MPALEMPFGAEGWNPARLGDLSGRAFVVTGTTTGCGFQCAKLLLSKGAQVVMLNRSAERSAAAVEMLKAGGGDVAMVRRFDAPEQKVTESPLSRNPSAGAHEAELARWLRSALPDAPPDLAAVLAYVERSDSFKKISRSNSIY